MKKQSVKLTLLVLLLIQSASGGPAMYGVCVAACYGIAYIGGFEAAHAANGAIGTAAAATIGLLAAAAAAGAAAGTSGTAVCPTVCAPFLAAPGP
jgi:hypothetical protein